MTRSLRSKLLLVCLVAAALPAAVLFLVGRGLLRDLAALAINPELRQSLLEAEKYGRAFRESHEADVVRAAAELSHDPALAALLSRRDAATLCPYLERRLSDFPVPLDLLEVHDERGRLICSFRRGAFPPIAVDTPQRILAGGRPRLVPLDAGESRIVAGSPVLAAGGQAQGVVLAGHRFDPRLFESVARLAEASAGYGRLVANKDDILRRYLAALALSGVLLIVFALLLSSLLGRAITRPVRELAAGTAALARGELSHRVLPRSTGELAQLAHAFNEMAARLESQRDALASQKRFIETVLREVPTGIVALDASLGLIAANRVACALLSVAPEAVPCALPAGSVRDAVVAAAAAADRTGEVAEEECHLRREGTERRLKLRVAALPGPDASGLARVAVLEDLTDLIEAQRLSAWREVAQRIAHEVKNPLTPISLSAQHLLAQWEALGRGELAGDRVAFGQALSQGMKTISEEADALRRMVEEFSLFARMPKPRRVSCDLPGLVRGVLRLYETDGRARVSSDLSAAPRAVWCDPDQMRRVVINLVENAVQAIPGAGSVQVRLRASGGDAAVLEVSDSGQGIPADLLPRIFTPYFSTKTRGSGLGLAIVHRIVNDHGGTVEVESRVGEGSLFRVRLPGALAPAQADGEAA